jgi:hypothetical protein
MRFRASLFRHISIINGVLASFAAMFVFAGCSMLDSTKNANSGATPAPTQAAVTTSPTPPASAATPSSGPAIATSDGDKPGTRIEIQELKRTSGDTVTVKFAMVNDSDKALSFGYDYTDPDHSVKDFGGIGGIHLIDAAGKKKYFVVRDTENTCVCSNKVPDISPKSRANLWAKFPAPPADVQKINIVIPHFIPADDVPIS